MTTQNDKDLARLMQIADEFKRLANLMHNSIDSDPPYVKPEVTKTLDDWILELCSPAAKLNREIKTRDPEDIQKAHDVFRMVIEGDVRLNLPHEVFKLTHACADCLCWVLDHNHGPEGFQKNLNALMDLAAERGYVLKKIQ